MKRLLWMVAVMLVLLAASTASAGWGHGVPVTVYSFYPVGPVYAYPQVVAVPVAPPPLLVPAAVVYPAPPAVVRARVSYHGRPVRNTIRVVGW
jgi:hypothetical protein